MARNTGRNMTLEDDIERLGDNVLEGDGPAMVQDDFAVESIRSNYDIVDLKDVMSEETTADGKVILDRDNQKAAYVPDGFRELHGDCYLSVEDYGEMQDVIGNLRERFGGNAEIDEIYR